ncbi:hypothetical protein [Chitinophaga sp.]|uniref:hypothetical protein n=1 Tax=Chitinophaga sp. TaxID=1869181 RepID=UPI0031D30E36
MSIHYSDAASTLKFAKELSQTYQNTISLSKGDVIRLFSQVTAFLGVHPQEELKKYLAHRAIVLEVLFYLQQNQQLTRDDRFEMNESLKVIYKLLSNKRSGFYYQFRLLGTSGFYPNCTLKGKHVLYNAVQLKPTLLTQNKYETEEKFINGSELSIMTRNELKFATSIICASNGLDHIYLNSFETISLDADAINSVPKALHLPLFMELLEYKKQFSPQSHFGGEIIDSHHRGHYFKSFEECLPDFYAVFSKYSIRDKLLMRTSHHLMKAIMLWDNRFFAEDAISHTFIGLEGCLHLLQRKWGDRSIKINMKFIEQKFKDEIDPTGQIFDYIKEGHYTRNTILHPAHKWGIEWMPFLMAADFYDYFKIARDLLFYSITNKHKEIRSY